MKNCNGEMGEWGVAVNIPIWSWIWMHTSTDARGLEYFLDWGFCPSGFFFYPLGLLYLELLSLLLSAPNPPIIYQISWDMNQWKEQWKEYIIDVIFHIKVEMLSTACKSHALVLSMLQLYHPQIKFYNVIIIFWPQYI